MTATYKRIDHFIEYLDQFDNFNMYSAESFFLEIISRDLSKRYLGYTVKNIQDSIFRNSLYDCHEYVHFIFHRLNKKKIPLILQETRLKLIEIFVGISDSWSIIMPPRTSFFSYRFVLLKLSELLNLKDLIVFFHY